jgi:hypothetical protein
MRCILFDYEYYIALPRDVIRYKHLENFCSTLVPYSLLDLDVNGSTITLVAGIV